jgi:ribose transport system substrate-binding protein
MKGKKVVFFPIVGDAAASQSWSSSFKRIFERLGAHYSMRDSNFDANRMAQQLDAQIADGADVLIVQPPDPDVVSNQIKQAQQKGIYVITLTLMSSARPDAFVGSDYTGLSAKLAERVASDCKARGKNKVAVLDGLGTDSLSTTYNEGWEPVFKEAGIEVAAHQQAKYDPTVASQVASTVLQKNPDLCAFRSNWDIPSLGVAKAVARAGKTGEIGIYNVDASAPWCAALRRGEVTAGVANNLPAMAAVAAAQAQQLVQTGGAPGSQGYGAFVPDTIIDKTNVDDLSGACYSGKG